MKCFRLYLVLPCVRTYVRTFVRIFSLVYVRKCVYLRVYVHEDVCMFSLAISVHISNVVNVMQLPFTFNAAATVHSRRPPRTELRVCACAFAPHIHTNTYDRLSIGHVRMYLGTRCCSVLGVLSIVCIPRVFSVCVAYIVYTLRSTCVVLCCVVLLACYATQNCCCS